MKQNIVILYGGGLDSSALAVLCGASSLNPDTVTLFHVDYGQKAVDAERRSMQYFADKYGFRTYKGTLDLSFSQARIMKNTPIGDTPELNRLELRNLALISYAASYAATVFPNNELVQIAVGFHIEPQGSGFADAKPQYLKQVEAGIRLACGGDIRLISPFKDLTRFEILKTWSEFDPDLIDKSHTCYEAVACGKCTHCIERERMLNQLKDERAQS